MKQTYIATLLALAIVNPIFAADAKDKHMHHSPMTAMIAEKSGAEFEAAFLAMMIHHHMGGAPMWSLAREKSKDSTVLALERKTTPKEKAEIEKMTGWLKEWHKKTPEDFKEPEESRQMMEKDMAELKSAKAEKFDALFAQKMAMHHKAAIEMCELAEKKSEHAELKKFATELGKAQASDREKLLSVAKANQ